MFAEYPLCAGHCSKYCSKLSSEREGNGYRYNFLRVVPKGAEISSRARPCTWITEHGNRVAGIHQWEMGVHLEAGRDDIVNRVSY